MKGPTKQQTTREETPMDEGSGLAEYDLDHVRGVLGRAGRAILAALAEIQAASEALSSVGEWEDQSSLTVRTRNVLRRAGLGRDEVRRMDDKALASIAGIGPSAVKELREWIRRERAG